MLSATQLLRDPKALAWHVLRVGAAMCFIGHGAFGIITKEAWVPYFGLVGISPGVAYTMMPVVGVVDIALGVLAILRPMRAVFAWMVVWGAWTASLRPFTGEPVWELLERAGNYGVPLALLLIAGVPRDVRGWFVAIRQAPWTVSTARYGALTFRLTTAVLLLGHAGLGLQGKNLLTEHYATLGLSSEVTPMVGGFELGLGAALVATTGVVLPVAAGIWKILTESLFVFAGSPFWEFIERGGSYAAPFALSLLVLAARPRAPAVRGGAARSRPRPVPVRGMLLLVSGLVWTAHTPDTVSAVTSARPASPAEVVIGVSVVDTVWARVERRDLLRQMREGSLVFACRHAITDRSRGDARRVDFSDRSTQRNLSPAGERQARDLGRAIASLELPVGQVYASPYARNVESAELTFGRAESRRELTGEQRRTAIEPYFAEPTDGRNRAIVTHQYILRQALRRFRGGQIAEGDCIVVRPDEEHGFVILEHLGPVDWADLERETSHRPRSRPGDVEAAYGRSAVRPEVLP